VAANFLLVSARIINIVTHFRVKRKISYSLTEKIQTVAKRANMSSPQEVGSAYYQNVKSSQKCIFCT